MGGARCKPPTGGHPEAGVGGGGAGRCPPNQCSALGTDLPGKGVLDPGCGLWALSSLPPPAAFPESWGLAAEAVIILANSEPARG